MVDSKSESTLRKRSKAPADENLNIKRLNKTLDPRQKLSGMTSKVKRYITKQANLNPEPATPLHP